ncbi:MAG: ABC transporter substrate-binding protein [Armatimonadota bacterium]|nr:ABC transporter substrate-binding protein [Armatimonadota bacterium]MDR7532027.1 ABC transporter substrate-binding protein [Armatimonadota bacterium]MDR7535958.1 ABC transporter substrate-binding protein [Armatimonadota bacterium]
MGRTRSWVSTARHAGLALVVGLLVTAHLAGGAVPGRAGAPLEKVVVAHVPLINFATLYVAVERGFMAQQGIEVELVRVASGTEALVFLAQDRLDVGAIGLAASIFNAFNRRLDLRIVASTSSWGQRHGTKILTRVDLFDAGEVRSVRDLKGRRVAVAGGPGSAGHYLFLLGARRGGIGPRDFELVNLPNPNHGAALAQGRVDASLTGSPFAAAALAQVLARPLLENFAPGTATTVFAYSGGFMRTRPATATRFLAALIQAARAMQGQKYFDEENLAAYRKYTGVRDEVLRAEVPLLYYPDMRIVTGTIVDMEKTFREAGLADYTAPLPLEAMVTTTFQQEALARLGRANP